jgi:hypothetical protein
MPGEDIDLDHSADVLWLPSKTGLPPEGIIGEEQRHFASLREALIFVMETLPLESRATARITLSAGSLTIEEIELLYQAIGMGESSA